MTRRRSMRELEREIDDMVPEPSPNDDRDVPIVFEDAETGEWEDPDGEPVDRDEADPLLVIEEDIVETGWEGSA